MTNVQVEQCPTCSSKKVDITQSINRVLYVAIYLVMVGIASWIAIAVQGSPVVYLFLGLGAAFILFVIRLVLEKRKITKCLCLDCGTRWQFFKGQ
jgi:uncharacterized membrane protein